MSVNDIGPKFLICPSIHPLLLIRVGGGAGAYFSYHNARGRVHSGATSPVTGVTKRDTTPFTLKFTPVGNLESLLLESLSANHCTASTVTRSLGLSYLLGVSCT